MPFFIGVVFCYNTGMNLADYLKNKILRAIQLRWPEARSLAVEISQTPDQKFGDYSSAIAMKLASTLHQAPLVLAQEVKSILGSMPPVSRLDIVAPGYLNFFINEKWLLRQVDTILQEKEKFGQNQIGQGKKVQVEFVSANPTGPLHLGNGRGGFTGDVLAKIFKASGYRVQREYYVNNVGKQVGVLAESVLRRYWQQQGIRIEYPEYCYQGKYVDDLARQLFLPNYKFSNVQKLEVVRDKIKGRILEKMVSQIRRLLVKRLGIKYDRWFYENTLYSSGQVDRVTKELKKLGLLYRSEGAIWLKTSQFGDEKDRVLIKANDEPVYFLSDIAYHWDKLEVILVQLVRLIKDGKEFKMSKRQGTFVTLDELIDEVGPDAARFFFLMHDFGTHMDFDLDLAKKKSQQNPVYYVQYAHARICSIIRKAKKLLETELPPATARLEAAESDLLKTMIRWPELVADVCRTYQVSRLTSYATELATRFHDFYTQCRIINGQSRHARRYQLLIATQQVLRNVLEMMGISYPEKM